MAKKLEPKTYHVEVNGVQVPATIESRKDLTGGLSYRAACEVGGERVESDWWTNERRALSELGAVALVQLKRALQRERELAKLARWNAGLPLEG